MGSARIYAGRARISNMGQARERGEGANVQHQRRAKETHTTSYRDEASSPRRSPPLFVVLYYVVFLWCHAHNNFACTMILSWKGQCPWARRRISYGASPCEPRCRHGSIIVANGPCAGLSLICKQCPWLYPCRNGPRPSRI